MNLHLDSFLLAAGFTNLDDVKKVISKINLTNVHFSLSLSSSFCPDKSTENELIILLSLW